VMPSAYLFGMDCSIPETSSTDVNREVGALFKRANASLRNAKPCGSRADVQEQPAGRYPCPAAGYSGRYVARAGVSGVLPEML
jgi:hypothetical protein